MHRGDTNGDLQQHGRRDSYAGPGETPALGAGQGQRPEREQHRACGQGAQSMREVDRHPGGIGEHPALIVDSESVLQHECRAEIHLRPPRPLAGGKVRACHRGVIRARPAAEKQLPTQHCAGEHCERAQVSLARRKAAPWRRYGEPPQQRQGGQAAQQMSGHDQRFQQQRHRERAQRPLQADHHEQQCDGVERLLAVVAPRDGPNEQARDDEDQRACHVAMDHLVPGLADLAARLRIQMPVTPRPIRAAEAGIGETHPGAQHDHGEREQGTHQSQAAEPQHPLLRTHAQPTCESPSNRLRS